jgi:2-desacetyl-2-hydroxyethyl bacteriochlorophyllide A dehydrogenase
MPNIAAYYKGDHRFELRDAPVLPPAADEVQIEVAWCGICGTDLHVFHGAMDQRVGSNRIIGHEMSGTIAALGAGVSGLAIGDKVVVRPLKPCGHCPACAAGHSHICHNLKFLGLDTDGAMQRYWSVPAYAVHKLPDEMPLDLAALVEPLAVACHDIERARLAPGETVLVIGGGPIGMLIAIAAAKRGARVLLSEINLSRLTLAASFGIGAFDASKTDVAREVMAATGGKGADVVFEVSGVQAGVDLMTEAVSTRGRVVMVAIHAKKPVIDLFRFFWREIEMLGARVYEPQDYEAAIELLVRHGSEIGRVITERRPLSEIQTAFESFEANGTSMKTLLNCQEGAAQ